MTAKKKPIPDQPESDRPELADTPDTTHAPEAAIDPEAESAAAASDTFEQASDDLQKTELGAAEDADEEQEPSPEPPPELKRLQKILAQSGIASRRHAEELITQGRVQVNGKVVTELGRKADMHRDHIRVDGKLLHGSERQRYFMLNKPKGYVTTVSDPEGRPTIMEFFSKTRERLYPVGRLDYLSEGLLLVTNDGELANKLTRAASGVEKTYLVKVSGQPSEEALDRLRQGVAIQKDKSGSGRVQTAPAEIRPFRPGKPSGKRGPSRPVDNPWYEVVLIEGRNRELRKMFEEIGHHVEKIRRVGYGPLVLDLEPGKIRELEPEEVENLRKAAEGTYRKPKTRERRSRESAPRADRLASKPRWNERRTEAGSTRNTGGMGERRPFRSGQSGLDRRPESSRQRPERGQFPTGPGRGSNREAPREFRPAARSNPRFQENQPQRPPRREQADRPYGGPRENRGRFAEGRPRDRAPKPEWVNKPERGSRPPRFEREAGTGRPPQRSFQPRAGSRPGRELFNRPAGGFRPKTSDSPSPQRFAEKRPDGADRFTAKKRLEIRPAEDNFDSQPTGAPPRGSQRPFQPRTGSRPFRPQRQDRPQGERPDRSRFDRSSSGARGRQTSENRPPRRDREKPVVFDRPRRDSRATPPGETHSERPGRRPGQGPPATRSDGTFRPVKRGGPGGKQSGQRPGSGHRSGPRPGGNRPNKRRS